jgi:hypothetical protein
LQQLVKDHSEAAAKNIKEEDLLRAAGPLSLLGLDLSAYVGRGYDCPRSRFQFDALPPYPCPVEVKKRSADFIYQVTRYADLPRAVVLCMRHDYVNPPPDIDVLELATLSDHLKA